ncbi:hypothetical protein [Cupriavidus sp. D39]|uniref:hypothetical protein n=1 Tax=Cupriavidus sp. D39 TaxID=2997877 RepID=UPI00226D4B54|nr:hypothetical protein [Cupriavidus sp. D39]MCY0853770.1 hypothetical protein [Cupriavidus sp. D39]
MLSKLNALRKEVRALSRKAVLTVSKNALPGGPAYYEHLARFFDDLILRAAGELQIVGLAAAVELGVAARHHLTSVDPPRCAAIGQNCASCTGHCPGA